MFCWMSSHNTRHKHEENLANGFNFTITPWKIPTDHHMQSWSVHNNKQSNTICLEVSSIILKKSRPPEISIPWGKHRALHTVNKKKEIVILLRNKGNCTTLMYIKEFNRRMNTIIKPTKSHLTHQCTWKRTKTFISTLPKDIKWSHPKRESSWTLRIYGLSKIHKQDCLLKTVTSAFNCQHTA